MVEFVHDLLIILSAGLVAGIVCKRLGLSMLVGYLLAGVAIGRGGLGLIVEDLEEIEYVAHVGALLLLFAIGIEFSLEDLVRLSRYFFVGGSIQMVLVAAPVVVVCAFFGYSWKSALLIASATALSSTVLVFRALGEWGRTASPQGRRAIGILLFQDVALVPLMLLLPLLASKEQGPQTWNYLLLALNSALFVLAVVVLRGAFASWFVPMLSKLRSTELLILSGLIVLVGLCFAAVMAGLPPALGAFAAGLVLSGNRLTNQVEALTLPYRESFGVVFFVSLGTLLDFSVLLADPLVLIAAFAGLLVVKSAAATFALRATGLPWHAAAAMGLGLAQMGELSFVVLSEGLHLNLIGADDYSRMLFLAFGTLVLTPPLLGLGFRWTHRPSLAVYETETHCAELPPMPQEAIVIGLGPVGRQSASQMEMMGVDVCLIDVNPVNLHAYAQQGFRTVSGDARDLGVLDRADAARSRLAIVCVPDDRVAYQIVKALHRASPTCTLIVRCRYQSNMPGLRKAGATEVISEEAEASGALGRLLGRMTSL